MLRPRCLIIRSIEAQILTLACSNHELMPRERHVDRPVDDTDLDSREHGLQLGSTLRPAVAAIRDEQSRLAPPLVEEVVDGVLELGGDAPVPLRRDEDEGVAGCDTTRPDPGVFVRVVFGRLNLLGNAGLVEDGETLLREVDAVKCDLRL